MQDRPDARELVIAIEEFVRNEIAPTIDDKRLKFRTLVALNGLGILARELEQEEVLLREELNCLAPLLGRAVRAPETLSDLKAEVLELNRELARRIREGLPPHGTAQAVKLTVAGKLKVANPRSLEERVRG
jgi:Domain of unknown function (DUF6285)